MNSLKKYACPVYSLKLVRERTVRYRAPIDHPTAAASAIKALIGETDREHFVVLFLNTAKEVVGAHIAFVGSLDSIGGVTVREVFKAAIVANASAIVLGHSHPSGALEPSAQDLQTTDHLVAASRIVGIPILDHVIVGGDATPYSFYEAGLLP